MIPQTTTKSVSLTKSCLYYEMSKGQAVQARGGSERDLIIKLASRAASKED